MHVVLYPLPTLPQPAPPPSPPSLPFVAPPGDCGLISRVEQQWRGGNTLISDQMRMRASPLSREGDSSLLCHSEFYSRSDSDG